MKICGCINEKHKKDIIRTADCTADLVEHRIDYMEEIDLQGLYNNINKPVIATNRPAHEGGHFKDPEENRKRALISAIENGADYVDIELDSQKEDIIQAAKRQNCRVIVSYHNFRYTPLQNELREILQKQKKQADIGKIATMPASIEDCHRVLELILQAKKQGFPLIAFCMGELGKFTRSLALIYGSPFMYASINKTNAPGQINVQELRKITEKLK